MYSNQRLPILTSPVSGDTCGCCRPATLVSVNRRERRFAVRAKSQPAACAISCRVRSKPVNLTCERGAKGSPRFCYEWARIVYESKRSVEIISTETF